MAPQLLFDISTMDLEQTIVTRQEIEAFNPHRGNMMLLDAIVYVSEDKLDYVAYHDIREDAFWVAGHIPGRPLFPGVLMIEAGAQLASYNMISKRPETEFVGFAGVDNVRFRSQVTPGDRLYLLMRETEIRRRRCLCQVQGVVRGQLVFEGQIRGMPM